MAHPYNGIEAVLTTQHHKEKLIAPALAPLGIKVIHHQFDTDLLGTFSGEIPRTLSQRDTALKKARIGMEDKGIRFGLASEGSIGADPLVPFINSAIEAIAWIDDVHGIEIMEYERGTEVIAVKTDVSSIDELGDFLERADFPNHALICYQAGGKGNIYKGLRELAALEEAIQEITKRGSAVVESDLRAHMSPSRSEVIKNCAQRLANRLSRQCDECGTPGFGTTSNLYGLNCEECGELVSKAVRGELESCAKCSHKQEQLNGRAKASAAQCERCNP
ncbi:MAG: hypothetical protein FGM63_01710 [Candidatus Nanopelagicaceae bacterium]|nr:hypothetical protein [Candidatus Nanopelagicaceae bacterium]